MSRIKINELRAAFPKYAEVIFFYGIMKVTYIFLWRFYEDFKNTLDKVFPLSYYY